MLYWNLTRLAWWCSAFQPTPVRSIAEVAAAPWECELKEASKTGASDTATVKGRDSAAGTEGASLDSTDHVL